MPEHLRQYRLHILTFVLYIAVLLGVIYLLRRPEPRVIAIVTPAPRATATEVLVQVQVSGAVLQPGVYQLPSNARVSNALDSAGGARPDADLDRLNLARKLNDGEALMVPTRAIASQVPTAMRLASPAGPTGVVQAKLNLNTATVDELDKLPRIGPVLAQRIVDYRNQNGPFNKVEEIKNVQGIGDSLFNGIKDLVTTAPNDQ